MSLNDSFITFKGWLRGATQLAKESCTTKNVQGVFNVKRIHVFPENGMFG